MFVVLMLWAQAVADSGYRNPLTRFTALVSEVAASMNLPPPMVLPTDVPLFGYDRVSIGTLQQSPEFEWEDPTYIILVRIFFLQEEGSLAWRVGITHELCHIELHHFNAQDAMTDESEISAEQCAYDRNTDEAFFAWVRANLKRDSRLSPFARQNDEFLREVVIGMVGIKLREP